MTHAAQFRAVLTAVIVASQQAVAHAGCMNIMATAALEFALGIEQVFHDGSAERARFGRIFQTAVTCGQRGIVHERNRVRVRQLVSIKGVIGIHPCEVGICAVMAAQAELGIAAGLAVYSALERSAGIHRKCRFCFLAVPKRYTR